MWESSAESPGAPPRWARALAYFFTWGPAFVVFGHAAKFGPIFEKLDAKGELPPLTKGLMAAVELNASCFYLLEVLVILPMVMLDELMVSILSRQTNGKLKASLWFAGTAAAGFVVTAMLVAALLLPVFKMSSIV